MTSVKVTDEMYPVMLKEGVDLPYLVRGADWYWSFQVMEDDNVTPMDTTSWVCNIYVKESANGDTYTTLTNGSGVTMTAASGLFSIAIDDAVVDAYTFNTAAFKVIMTDSTGKKIPYFIGTLRFVG